MGKAGEDFRQLGDRFIVVAWNVSPFQVDFSATIFVKFPSSSLENSLALSSSGHQILTELKSLDDLDQDGWSNLIEAGAGSSPTDPMASSPPLIAIHPRRQDNI